MPRVWNITDIWKEPISIVVGGVQVSPGGSMDVKSGKLRGMSRKNPPGSFHVGVAPPRTYLVAKKAARTARIAATTAATEGPKTEKSSKPSKKKKKKPKSED